MLNFDVPPAILRPFVPPGVELDFHNGISYASLVGFRFIDTRVLGLPIPFHRDFDEVNLRFYVRRFADGHWRRGVVFIREIVPRAAIAFVARTFYGEPYSAFPMRHQLSVTPDSISARYEWRRAGQWEFLAAQASGQPGEIQPGSGEEFIAEHYWGYTRRRGGLCSEYEVLHPRWRVWQCAQASFQAGIAALYGPEFVEPLSAQPRSAFIADGSPVSVRYCSSFAA